MSTDDSFKLPSGIKRNFIQVNDQQIHYLSGGSGQVVLFLHGWPTSGYLWRNVMSPLTDDYRVIAPDLVGFGDSAKPLDVSYSLNFQLRILDAFLDQLDISSVHLVVHDFGGPVGVLWAVRNMDKVRSLTLTNTLVFPKFSWAVKLFVFAVTAPGIREWLSGPAGIRFSLRLGVYNRRKLTRDFLRPYWEPFQEREASNALLKTIRGAGLKGYYEIAEKLPEFRKPIQGIYGTYDWILPDVAKTMRSVQSILPQMEITPLPKCGHFLQEDNPGELSRLLMEFLKKTEL